MVGQLQGLSLGPEETLSEDVRLAARMVAQERQVRRELGVNGAARFMEYDETRAELELCRTQAAFRRGLICGFALSMKP